MSSSEIPSIAIIFKDHGIEVGKKPKMRWYHWIGFYAFNLYRKPMVWRKQKELQELRHKIKSALGKEMLPELWQNRLTCKSCADAYVALKSQVFLSQIEMILNHMKCDKHLALFLEFRLRHRNDFTRNEEISRWINNL